MNRVDRISIRYELNAGAGCGRQLEFVCETDFREKNHDY